MVVDTGDSCHSLYELVIIWMAIAKQDTTIATQTALAALDLAVEMCTRPWIVELSKNSRIDAVANLYDYITLLSPTQYVQGGKTWVKNMPPSKQTGEWGLTATSWVALCRKLNHIVDFPLANRDYQQIIVSALKLCLRHFKLPINYLCQKHGKLTTLLVRL